MTYAYAEEKDFVIYEYNADPSYQTNHAANNNNTPSNATFVKGESLHGGITGVLGNLVMSPSS
jgi:hypothetical protein